MKYISSINAFLVEASDIRDGVLFVEKIEAPSENPRFIATDDVLKLCKKVIFGYKVEAIPPEAFSSWDIEEVRFGNNTHTVGARAFDGCLLKKLNTANLVNIGKEAFSDNETLEEVYIGEAVASIGEGAFKDNDSLKRVVIDPKNKGLTTFAEHCFENDEQLETVENIDSRLYKPYAFEGCGKLKLTLSQKDFIDIGHYGPNEYNLKPVFSNGAEITVLVEDYNAILRSVVDELKESGVIVSAIPVSRKAKNQLFPTTVSPEETALKKAQKRLAKISKEMPQLREDILKLQIKLSNLPVDETKTTPVEIGKTSIKL